MNSERNDYAKVDFVQCKHCQRALPLEHFPVAYHYRGKPMRRWECRPCLADLARIRRTRKSPTEVRLDLDPQKTGV